jgi:hypothetical protein
MEGCGLWKLSHLGGHVSMRDCGISHVVNDVADCAQITQSHGDHVVEADAGRAGRLDGVVEHNIWITEY